MKKKARKSPFNAPTKKTAKSINNGKTGKEAKLNAELLSLCEEFFEILKDNEVMEEVKEVMRRAKTKKDTEKEEKKGK